MACWAAGIFRRVIFILVIQYLWINTILAINVNVRNVRDYATTFNRRLDEFHTNVILDQTVRPCLRYGSNLRKTPAIQCQISMSNVEVSRRCLKLANAMMVAFLLQCGDISVNPGPVSSVCGTCLKSIRRNQSTFTCESCLNESHLRCAVSEFDDGVNKGLCRNCLIIPVAVDDSGEEEFNVGSLPELVGLNKTRGLKIIHQNVRSLPRHIDQVNFLVLKNPRLHILGISETWLNPDINDSEVTISNYKLERSDRRDRIGGGCAVYIVNYIPYIRREDLEQDSLESVWIEVVFPYTTGLLIGNFYRPPDDMDFLARFEDNVESALAEGKEVILMGDFNYNLLNRRSDKQTRDFRNLLQRLHLHIQITKPTRLYYQIASLLDLIITSHPENILASDVVHTGISDHEMVIVIRRTHIKKSASRIIKCRNYKHFDENAFRSDLSNIQWEVITQIDYEGDINIICDKFNKIFSDVCDKHAPLFTKKVRGSDSPWLNYKIKKLIKERDHFWKKARQKNTEYYWSTYKTLRNKVTSEIRKSKATYHRSLVSENSGSPDKFWTTMKKLIPNTKDKSVSQASMCIDGNLITNIQEIADHFCLFFTNIAKTIVSELQPTIQDYCPSVY